MKDTEVSSAFDVGMDDGGAVQQDGRHVPEDDDEEYRRDRRERGKIAQQRFRKRQKQAIHELRATNTKLKLAITELNRAGRRRDLSKILELLDDAVKVAGIADIKGSTSTPAFKLDPSTTMFSSSEVDQDQTVLLGDAAVSRIDSGRMSPRFDYAFLFDSARLIRIVSPPVDIVPYLGPGLNTFAGRLHWACLTLCHDMCNNYITTQMLTPQSHPHLRRMLEHSLPLHNVRYIGAMAEARLEFMQIGYTKDEESAGRFNSGLELMGKVQNDYISRGKDFPTLLDCNDVARRLQLHMGALFEHLTAAVVNTRPGRIAHRPIRDLASEFVCYGEGPRWTEEQVNRILRRYQDVCEAST